MTPIGTFVTYHSETGGDQLALLTGRAEDAETHALAADLTAFPRGGPPYAVTSVLEGPGPNCWSGAGKPRKASKKKSKK